MKRNIKMLIAAVAVLLLLTGAYFIAISWEPENDEEALDDTSTLSDMEYLIDEEMQNIDYVEFNNGETAYTIKNGSEYSVEGYSSHIFEQNKLSSAVYSAARVAISRKVKVETTALEEYGLKSEDKYVAVRLKSGEERRLIIGNSTNVDGEYYAKLSASDSVCTISSYTAQELLKEPGEYRSLEICSIASDTIKAFAIEKSGKKELEVVFDEEYEAISEHQPAAYLIKYPYDGVAASYDKLNVLFESITSLTADSIVEENPSDLKEYGLEKPYVLTVRNENSTKTVKMGSYADGGGVYVMCNDVPVVYIAQCPFYETVKNAKADEYVERFINLFVIDDVESVVVFADGNEHKMEINEKSDKAIEYKINGRRTTEDKFKEIYQLVIGITAAEFTNDAPSGEEKCSITFNFRDKTSKKFTYYVYNERNCIVKADNGLVCLAMTKSVDEMLDAII